MANKKWALISVTDKTGIIDFARGLVARGFSITSTGGSATVLAEAGIAVTEVASLTHSPEVLDGRVKTLHPIIHGGLLYDRRDASHAQQAEQYGFPDIQIVAVNLYPFEDKGLPPQVDLLKSIHFIDIGGPTLLRGAAKNFATCYAVIDPDDYPRVLADLDTPQGLSFRQQLAAKVFGELAHYNYLIAEKLKITTEPALPEKIANFRRTQSLRYGENPDQAAAVYRDVCAQGSTLTNTQPLQGKALSYNNYLDLDAATRLIADLSPRSAWVIIKHTNACGAAVARSQDEAPLAIYERALSADPISAFGGIAATNREVDAATASRMSAHFFECIAAPLFSEEARFLFSKKENLRLLEIPSLGSAKEIGHGPTETSMRSIWGGLLVQTTDAGTQPYQAWRCVTQKAADSRQQDDLLTAQTICKHIKSNAIVLVKDGVSIGIGAGQMSRVDATRSALQKALAMQHSTAGSVLASDAFFPFDDCVRLAAEAGITAIVQPGGSKKDQDSVAACDALGVSMYFSGRRHFRH